MDRYINPSDIVLPPGYKADVFASGLTAPINIILTESGEMYIADAGISDGNGKVLKYMDGQFRIVADGFTPPLTGINSYKGSIYVSHRGKITKTFPDGSKSDIIEGLPSWGDHHNNQVIFGPDDKMYFGQGTATNSGVVGEDNKDWVEKHPDFHDYPGADIILNGKNFITENFLTSAPLDKSCTGSYSPFGVPSSQFEKVKGVVKASGSILRANPDGSNLELVAWGLRNPFRIKFDRFNRLFCANHGADVRGSRPIENSPDEFQVIKYGIWYGWPDFFGGLPVTLPAFKPEGHPQPEFILASHPMLPPRPFAVFADHSAIMGFDFSCNPQFGFTGDAYIAEFGSEAPGTTGGKPLPGVGHRISKIEINTGLVSTFAINRSGVAASYSREGGFERPIDVIFDSSGNMYIADFGLRSETEEDVYLAKTGVIWKISRVA